MKMKIVALAVLFVLLVPGLNAFAYEGGIMHLQNLKVGSDVNTLTTSTNLMTDGDESTHFTLTGDQKVAVYEVPGEATINSIKFKSSGYVTFQLQDKEGKILHTVYQNVNSGSKYFNAVSGVAKIVLYAASPSSQVADFDAFGTIQKTIQYDPVTNLSQISSYQNVDLTWENPDNSELKEIILKQDGIEIDRLPITQENYKVEGLEPETNYSFEVIAVYSDGKEADSALLGVKTPPPKEAGEIQNLQAEPTHERINLSWDLPNSDVFKHVNIYRDELTETAFIDRLLGIEKVSAAATTKIFETNGTYFNDLTVEAEKEYEYTLTTYSTEGAESEGVTTTVETPEAPPPEIIGGDYTKDPATGDFIYTWDEPTEGQVKVFLDGTEYKTVDSADKKIVIPAAEMKYDYLGDPLLSLQPIGTDGKIGETVETGSAIKDMALPFGPLDLLKSGNGLLMVIGGFLLLALSFLLVPKLIRMIKRALGKESEKEAAARRIKEEEKTRKTERRERERREAREARQAKGTAAAAAPATAEGISKATVTERQEKKIKETATKTAQKEPRTARGRSREGRQPKATREPRERTRATRAPRNGRR